MVAGSSGVRRTQAARSAETRRKLLDATLEALMERGYAGTSAPDVCVRAGMSRGALLHHFPTKASLVVEAARQLAVVRCQAVEAHLDQLDRRPDGVRGAAMRYRDPIAQLGDVVGPLAFDPAVEAVLELWVAARTDADLAAALGPFEIELAEGFEALWRRLVNAGDGRPTAGGEQPARDLAQLTVHLLRGMALSGPLRDNEADRRRLLAHWTGRVVVGLGPDGDSPQKA